MTTALVLPGQLSATALTLPEGLTQTEWEAVGATLERIEGGIHWWRGDWLRYGEKRYGETFVQALDPITGKYQTLKVEAWVAQRIPPERRLAAVSWAMHVDVAGLPVDQQDAFLGTAARESWTRRDLKRAVKAWKVANGELVNRLTSSRRPAMTTADELDICARAAAGETYASIAAAYGVDEDRIGNIVRQRRAAEQRVPDPVPAPIPLPIAQRWRCIVIDPPWPMVKIEREVHPDQGRLLDYPTMPVPDMIGTAPVHDLADPEGCHVYLWTTQHYLPHAFWLLQRWDVRYQCLMTWVKPSGFTPYSWMYDTEHVLFGTFGRSLPLERMGLKLSFTGPVTRHSAKPDVFYDRVREASPGPRLELFARVPRVGFEVWGNEVTEEEGAGE